MTETTSLEKQLAAHKGWFVAAAIGLIVLGSLCIAAPLAASVVIDLLLGWLLLIGGAVKLAHAFGIRSGRNIVLHVLSGLLFVVVGILLLTHPLKGVLTLTLLLAILLSVEGVLKILGAFQVKPSPVWGWMLFSGIVTLFLGGLIWAQWPSSAAWVIGLLVGIDLLFSGWSMLFLGLAINKEAPAAA